MFRSFLTTFTISALLVGALARFPSAQQGGGNPTSQTAPIRRSSGIADPWQGDLWITPHVQANLSTGNLFAQFTTSRFLNGGLLPSHRLEFYFNSQAASKVGDYTGGFDLGPGWSTTVGSLLEFPSTGTAVLTRADGTEVTFEEQPNGAWQAPSYRFLTLEADGTEWVIRERNQYEFRYDAGGRLSAIEAPSGNSYSISHVGGEVQESHEVIGLGTAGRGATYSYDSSGRLDKITDVAGNEWALHYDTSGRLSQIDDPIYGSLLFLYDGQGRLSEYTDYSGNSWAFKYRNGNWQDRLRSAWDPSRERIYLFNYDDEVTEVTTRVTDIRGNVWRYRHNVNESPALKSIESPLGHTRSFKFDSRKLLTKYTDESGNVWNMTYAGNGRLRQVIDPESKTTVLGYDPLDSLEEIHVGPDEYHLHYDDPDLPTYVTRYVEPDVSGTATTVSEYFDMADGSRPGEWNGLLSKFIDAEGVETVFSYTGEGTLSSTTEGPAGAAGSVQTQVGRVTSYPQGATMSYPSSFPAVPSNPAGIQGRLQWTNTTGSSWHWRGTLENLSIDLQVPLDSGSGWETSNFHRDYCYDHRGRLIRLDETTDEVLEHVAAPPANAPTRSWVLSYDDLAPDQRMEVTTPDGDLTTLLRDEDGRLIQVFTNAGGPGELSTTYTYYANGRGKSETRNDGTSTHYSYLGNGALESIEHRDAGNLVLRIDYLGHNDRSQPTVLIETTPSDVLTRDFIHDARGRLVSESRTPASTGIVSTTSFTYDQVGNRLTRTEIVSGAVVESATYHYDSEDLATYQSDNNRLMWVETKNGSGQLMETVWFFYANPFGNVSRIVRQTAGSTHFTATAFVYSDHGSPWLMWDESWEDLGTTPVATRSTIHETRQVDPSSYLWRTRNSSSLIPEATEWSSLLGFWAANYSVSAMDGSTTGIDMIQPRFGRRSSTEATTYGFDSVGAVRLTSSGSSSSTSEYTAFGRELTSNSGEFGFSGAFLARHGFGGSSLSTNDISKLGYRFYGAEWGRFLMRDPLGVSAGPNVYAYVQNAPLDRVDRDGRQDEINLDWMAMLPGFDLSDLDEPEEPDEPQEPRDPNDFSYLVDPAPDPAHDEVGPPGGLVEPVPGGRRPVPIPPCTDDACRDVICPQFFDHGRARLESGETWRELDQYWGGP